MLILSMLCLVPAAVAQDDVASFPNRPIKIVVCVPAGGGVDTVTRIVAEGLHQKLGQPVVVENRAGAAGNIGAEYVFTSEPDGYTLLAAQPAPLTVNPLLYKKMNFDPTQFEPVAIMTSIANVLLVRPDFPAKTAKEFIAYVKANPGKVNYASPGVGTLPHVAGELFRSLTGVDIVHVPYRNAYLPDLLAGQVQAAFSPISTSLDFIAQGKLRPLGVTSEARADVLRDVPALAEAVPGYAAYIWDAIAAPRDTPAEVVGRLNREINAVLADPAVRARLIALGADPLAMSAADAQKFVVDETAKWGKVIRAAGIKAE
jgi:tripartite-type tricarboxylate transporter receptor subunit TctC